MRDRLVELIKCNLCTDAVDNGDFIEVKVNAEEIVDHILDDGWIRLPCKVGDMVYFIIEDDVTEEGKYISKQQINDVSTKGIFVSASFSEENCECFVPYSEFGKSAFHTEEEAERALKCGE